MVNERTSLMLQTQSTIDSDIGPDNSNTKERQWKKRLSTLNLALLCFAIGSLGTYIVTKETSKVTNSDNISNLTNNNDHASTNNNNNNGNPYDIPLKPTTNSKYTRVQGIGFQIYTGGAPALLNGTMGAASQELNPECIGRASYGQVVGEIAPELQCYLGRDDPIQDAKDRLQIMIDAVEKTYETVTASSNSDNDDGDDTTLKIFIAPEFFWRGVDGAYVFEGPDQPDTCGPVCHILKGLEEYVAQKRFENWLFLFGTVIASEVLHPNTDPFNYLFYNFGVIYKGYDPNTMDYTGKRFILPKRYVSSSDFLTPQRHLNASSFKELIGEEVPEHDTTVYNPFDFDQKRYDHSMWREYKDELNMLGYAMIEYDWLMVDGISMTTEICFDHQMRSALNSYVGDIVTGRNTLIPSSSDDGLEYVRIPEYQAQISLVSSAGMTVVPDSLALTDKGVIFLQDGLSNETNRMYWGVEGCELGLQFEGGTEAVQREAHLSPTEVMLEHKALHTHTRYDVYDNYNNKHWETALYGLFSTKLYPPQITIFDPMDIAKVSIDTKY